MQLILNAAQAEGDNALALRTIELMCKLNGLFDKQTQKLTVSQLNDQQIQDLINQLN
ncbi:MAG: hypothetical protein K0M45_03020 [Candidatus Paracaedibacteraceae bacterium]|nr:hypothetical protein [Candidatus Paracaedibacteraceae bacterium]